MFNYFIRIFWSLSVILYFIIVLRNPGFVERGSQNQFKMTSYQLEASILNSKDIQGNQGNANIREQTMSGVGTVKLTKKDIYAMAKSQSIKQNNLYLLQLQLQQQQQSQQLSTIHQNNNLANCSKSQLHEEFQSEMISQPHLNFNGVTQEQVINTNPNMKEINNMQTNNIPSHYHHYNLHQQLQQHQSSRVNRKQSSGQNLRHSQLQSNNQSGILGVLNQSGQADQTANIAAFGVQHKQNSIFEVRSLPDQQMQGMMLGGLCSQQLQYENQQQGDQLNTPTQMSKDNLQHQAGHNNNQMSLIQTSHFYNGPSLHINQTSHTELTSMNGQQQKSHQRYQICDEIGNEMASYNNQQEGNARIPTLPSRMHITKMSEIMRDDSNPYFSNMILKATHSEFGKTSKQYGKNQLHSQQNEEDMEYESEANNNIGGESEGGIEFLQALRMGIGDPNQFYNYEYEDEEDIQKDEELDRVESFRENSESAQSQQICLDDLNDEEEEEEKQSKQSKNAGDEEKQYEDDQNEHTLDIDELAKNNMNEFQTQNMIHKDNLYALKKRIVKGTLTAIDQGNSQGDNIELSQQQHIQPSQNMLGASLNKVPEEMNPDMMGGKKNKPRISFSPNIEQKLFIDDSIQNNIDLNEHDSRIAVQTSNKSSPVKNYVHQKQQKSIMKQRESYKQNLNDDTFQKIPLNSILNSYGSIIYQNHNNNNSNHLDVPISSNAINYNISFGKNNLEEYSQNDHINFNDEENKNRISQQQLSDYKETSQTSGYPFYSPRDNESGLVTVQSETHQSPNQANNRRSLHVQNVLEFPHQGGVFFKDRRNLVSQQNAQSPPCKEDLKMFFASQNNSSYDIVRDQDLLSPIQYNDQQCFNQRQSLLQNKIANFYTPEQNQLKNAHYNSEYYLENEASYRDKMHFEHENYGRVLFRNDQVVNQNNSNADSNFEQEYILSALSSNKLLNSHHHSRQNSNFLNSQSKQFPTGVIFPQTKLNMNNENNNTNNFGSRKGSFFNNEQLVQEKEEEFSRIHTSPTGKTNHLNSTNYPKAPLPNILNHFGEKKDNKHPYPSGSASSKNSSQTENHNFELTAGRSISTASNKKGGQSKYFQNKQRTKNSSISASSHIPYNNDHSTQQNNEGLLQSQTNTQYGHKSMINLQKRSLQIVTEDSHPSLYPQTQMLRSKSEAKMEMSNQNEKGERPTHNCRDSLNNLQSDLNEKNQGQCQECQKVPESLTFMNQHFQPSSMNTTKMNLTLTDNKLSQISQNPNRGKSNSIDQENSPYHLSPIGAISLLGFHKDINNQQKKVPTITGKYSASNINQYNNTSTNITNISPTYQSIQNDQVIVSHIPRLSSFKSVQEYPQSGKGRIVVGGYSNTPQANTLNPTLNQTIYYEDDNDDSQQLPNFLNQKSNTELGSHNGAKKEDLPIFSYDTIEGNLPRIGGQNHHTNKTYSAIVENQSLKDADNISNKAVLPYKKDSKHFSSASNLPKLKQTQSQVVVKSVAFNTQPSVSQLLAQQSSYLNQTQQQLQQKHQEQNYFQIHRQSSHQNQQNYNNTQNVLNSPSIKSNPPAGGGGAAAMISVAGVSSFKNNHTNLSNESFHQINAAYQNQLTPTSNRYPNQINNGSNNMQLQNLQRQHSSNTINNLYPLDSFTPQNNQGAHKRFSSNINQMHKLSTGMRNTNNTLPNNIFTTQGNTSQIPSGINPSNPNNPGNNTNNNNTNQNNNENNTMTNYTAPFYFEKRYCKVCNFDQPTRSKHCLICDRCISTYDHHCPWIGVCVAQRNHLFFYFFIVFQNIVTVFTIKEMIESIVHSIDWKVKSKIVLGVFSIIATFFLVYIFGMTIMLIAQHTYYILSNITTWEFYSWEKITYLKDLPRKLGSPFSLGVIKNIQHRIQCTFASHTYEWQVNKLRVPPYTNTITNQQ